MDDKRIEEMLRECWQPEPPNGLRDKVFRQNVQRCPISRWKLALAGIGVAVVILSGLDDSARGDRLACLTGSNKASSTISDLNRRTMEFAGVQAEMGVIEVDHDNGGSRL